MANVVNTINDRKSEICTGTECNAIVFTTFARASELRKFQCDVALRILGKCMSVR